MSKLSLKTMSLKDKILAASACAICLVIVAFVIYSIVTLALAFAPPHTDGPVDEGAYEFVFVGNITVYGEEYEVKLKGNDEKFTVDANKIKGVTGGTYKFTAGQGWTFTFDDAGGTVVRTQYDKAAKTFGFVYALDLGSRGAGNIKLTYAVDSFDAAAEAWQDIPSFKGTAEWFGGVVTAPTVISCDAEQNFRVFGTGGEIDEIRGTYVFENDTYVFTDTDDKAYTAVKDEATGLYTVIIEVYRPTLASYGPVAYTSVVFTQVVLTAD